MIDFVTLFIKFSFWDVTCSSFNPDDFRKFRDKRRTASSMFFSHSLLTFVRRDAVGGGTPRNGGCLCAVHHRTRAKAKSYARSACLNTHSIGYIRRRA